MTSFLDWGNAALDYYNDNPALQLGVQGGLSYLGSSGQRDANNSATGQIIQGQQQGLNALNKTWRTAQKQAAPYLNFGKQGLQQYNQLIQRPQSIRNDPGYLFRLNEGSNNLERSAAAAGTHLSGRTLADLTKYGQEYATAEYDKALNRRIPMIETGLSTQQNLATLGAGYAQAIGEIYGNIGEAGARGTLANESTRQGTIGDVSDILSRLSDGTSLASGAQKGLSMLGSNAPGAATTLASGVGAMEALGGAGTAAGVVGAPVAAPYAGGYAMQGSVAAMDALGGGGATALGGGGLSSLGAAPAAAQTGATGLTAGAAPTTVAAGSSGALTGVSAFGAYVAAPAAIILALNKFKNFKGGAAEGAKKGKFADQLSRDMQADPTGRAAQATLGKLVNGGLWAGEGNGWVVGDLINSGVLGLDSPLLYTKQSKFNPFATSDTKTDPNALGGNIEMLSYGIPSAQVDRYTQLQTKMQSAEREQSGRASSGDGGLNFSRGAGRYTLTAQDKAFMQSVESKLTPANRLRTATQTRAKILAANPRADVTKLNKFIKDNS